jgi:hypothetical protein
MCRARSPKENHTSRSLSGHGNCETALEGRFACLRGYSSLARSAASDWRREERDTRSCATRRWPRPHGNQRRIGCCPQVLKIAKTRGLRANRIVRRFAWIRLSPGRRFGVSGLRVGGICERPGSPQSLAAQLIAPLGKQTNGLANLLRQRLMGDTQFPCHLETFSENRAR